MAPYLPTRHTFSTPRTAHYARLGEPGPHVRHFWLVCHGYGQLAHKFIRPFASIATEDTLIIAPEGLSRFYWGGFDGPVVASWMTRGDRLLEIADYSNYLTTLYTHYRSQLATDVEVTLLGFSQGTATQVRWIMRTFPVFDRLILWAGQLPEDLDYTPHRTYWSEKQLVFIHGDADPFLTTQRMELQHRLFRKHQLAFAEYTFAGGHTVDSAYLTEWWRSVKQ